MKIGLTAEERLARAGWRRLRHGQGPVERGLHALVPGWLPHPRGNNS